MNQNQENELLFSEITNLSRNISDLDIPLTFLMKTLFSKKDEEFIRYFIEYQQELLFRKKEDVRQYFGIILCSLSLHVGHTTDN